MKYSICSTTYNIRDRIEKSLESILRHIDSNFEIVVVDNFSTDGTYEILKKYEKLTNLKVIQKKCKRGKGRQIAFENSTGEYVIAVDLDTVYFPTWRTLLSRYESMANHDKFALHAPYFGIYPRWLLERVGGWKNLQMGEDFELWYRLMQIGAFKWTPVLIGENWETNEPEKRQTKSVFGITYRKFIAEKDRFIARSEYSLKDRLQEVRSFTSRRNYYLFWVPLEVCAKICSMFSRPPRRDPVETARLWHECMIDFEDIPGNRLYDFITFPVR